MNPLWKQNTPADQFQSILMGLDGWVTITESGVFCDKKVQTQQALHKIREHVNQFQELIPYLQGQKTWIPFYKKVDG